ncbi:metabotropic glutamate receptor 2-like [Anneissia japonica]|uniref:metabotropic glutamate receptor 2-like n=1 Tax=Anneissia japonica TaxID=1529436 RepID=UPI00142594AD|nr:metabotropic glutamate receptor 2-like [Anneissia japonica]XP_033114632.1 metabotropic glutamate receptor 2-like [Anneissia japonica]
MSGDKYAQSLLITIMLLMSYRCFSSLHDEEGQGFHVMKEPGDVILGGLFPIHEKGSNGAPCGKVNVDRGIQRAQAMLYAVKKINNDSNLLNGLRLGAEIRDTCSLDIYALEQSLQFVRSSLSSEEFSNCPCDHDGSSIFGDQVLFGVIGGSYSTVTSQVANLLRLFKLPQISYASTSAQLSDKTRFDYFARTVPPDTLQAKAMVDIVAAFQWDYVSTVASEGQYGEPGIDQFEREARAKNICIAASETVPLLSNNITFDKIVKNLDNNNAKARAVILFTRMEDAREIMAAAQRAGYNFVWLASDGWGVQDVPVQGNEAVAQGAITIELQTKNIQEFDEYFLNLSPENQEGNAWFKEFWEYQFNCQLESNVSKQTQKQCDDTLQLTNDTYVQEKKIQFVVDAVYAMAHALDNFRHDSAKNCTFEKNIFCGLPTADDGKIFYSDYILNVTFEDITGSRVRFDERGDGPGRYDIMNYRLGNDNRYHYVNVGNWSMGTLHLDTEKVQFNKKLSVDNAVPLSQCSEPCKKGEVKNLQEGEPCCWICFPCSENEFLVDEFTCKKCKLGDWPNKEKTGCEEISIDYMHWNEGWSIIPVIFSLGGVIATLLVICIFIKFNDTPVVRASARELSYFLLAGVIWCYFMTFVILAKPSLSSCTLRRVGIGISFTMCYSALLTKTNRIARIFNSTQTPQRPKYISPFSQLIICMVMVGVQLVGSLLWLIIERPGTRLDYSINNSNVVLKCSASDVSLMVSLAYAILLVFCCTVYAFKTRKIPESFNEAKFIAFTMYTTCIVWLAFVPLYFGTANDFRVQSTTLCVAISLSATVTLGCMFLPKVYIIVCQPEKNVRSMSRSQARQENNTARMTSTETSYYGKVPQDEEGKQAETTE